MENPHDTREALTATAWFGAAVLAIAGGVVAVLSIIVSGVVAVMR